MNTSKILNLKRLRNKKSLLSVSVVERYDDSYWDKVDLVYKSIPSEAKDLKAKILNFYCDCAGDQGATAQWLRANGKRIADEIEAVASGASWTDFLDAFGGLIDWPRSNAGKDEMNDLFQRRFL